MNMTPEVLAFIKEHDASEKANTTHKRVNRKNPDPYNKIVQILYRLSSPAYILIRRLRIPTNFGGIDIAPIIIVLFLQFVDIFLVRLLNAFAISL